MKCGAEYRNAGGTNSVTLRFTTFWQADYKVVAGKFKILQLHEDALQTLGFGVSFFVPIYQIILSL
jgi:hypothetical protein